MKYSALAEVIIYSTCLLINYKNKNLFFLFLLLLIYQAFDHLLLAPQMAIIKPFYLEHFVEAMCNAFVCVLILNRARIAGWVHLDTNYIGYMQEFGLIALYVGFTLLSVSLFAEALIYWFTDFLAKPLPIRRLEGIVFVLLNSIEIYILISLTRQNVKNQLPVRYTLES